VSRCGLSVIVRGKSDRTTSSKFFYFPPYHLVSSIRSRDLYCATPLQQHNHIPANERLFLGDKKLLTCISMHRHAQLQSLGKSEASTQDNSGECAICLGAVLVGFLAALKPPLKTWVLTLPLALSIPFCCCMCSRLALQMHSAIAGGEEQHIPAFPMPQLPCLDRSFGRGRRCRRGYGRMDGQCW
jgi:hypothetical protein